MANGLLVLALAGDGSVCLSDFMTRIDRKQGALVQLLPRDTIDMRQPINAVYYRNTQLGSRSGCLLDYLREEMNGGWD